jgi:hypothetical protein
MGRSCGLTARQATGASPPHRCKRRRRCARGSFRPANKSQSSPRRSVAMPPRFSSFRLHCWKTTTCSIRSSRQLSRARPRIPPGRRRSMRRSPTTTRLPTNTSKRAPRISPICAIACCAFCVALRARRRGFPAALSSAPMICRHHNSWKSIGREAAALRCCAAARRATSPCWRGLAAFR